MPHFGNDLKSQWPHDLTEVITGGNINIHIRYIRCISCTILMVDGYKLHEIYNIKDDIDLTDLRRRTLSHESHYASWSLWGHRAYKWGPSHGASFFQILKFRELFKTCQENQADFNVSVSGELWTQLKLSRAAQFTRWYFEEDWGPQYFKRLET